MSTVITPEAQRISDSHRASMRVLGVQNAELFGRTLVMTKDVDDTQTIKSWMDIVYTLASRQKKTAGQLALRNYVAYRSARGIVGSVTPVLKTDLNRDQFEQSMRATVILPKVRADRRVIDLDDPSYAPAIRQEAQRVSLVQGSGAFNRLIIAGDRDTMLATADRDPEAIGWMRTIAPDACYFCKMLGSRGAVYLSEQSGGFDAHDHCNCGVAPVFDEDEELPQVNRDAMDLWRDLPPGLKGKDAMNAFRALVEGRSTRA